MNETLIQIIETLIVPILIPLIIYFYNKYKGIKLDKHYSYTKSLFLSHSLVDNEIKWSYGQAQINLNFNNHSNNNKLIKIKQLKFESLNYKLIEFDNIIFDYCIKFHNGTLIGHNEAGDSLFLYIINNGTSQSNYNKVILSVYGDESFLYYHERNINLNEGEIQELYQLNLNDNKLLQKFESSNYNYLNIKISYKNIIEEINIKYSDGKFVYTSPQLGSGSGVTVEKIIDLVINRDEKNYNNEPIKIEKCNSENLKVKIFSEKSASFDFQIKFKQQIVREKIELKVPVYNIVFYNSRLIHFGSFSRFMIEKDLYNFKINDSLIDTSSLYLYDIKNYLEKSNKF